MKPEIKITIHNGGGGTRMNSKEYIDWSCSNKPDYIEIDVRCTSDMTAVLHHDPFFVTNGENIFIEKINYDILKQYRPDIVSLDDAVETIAGSSIGINFDMKEVRAIESVVKILENKKIKDNIVFSGCKIEEIRKIKSINPELNVLFNADSAPSEPEQYSTFIRETLDTVKKEGFYGLNIDFNDCRQELLDLALDKNIPVMVWTIDNKEDMKKFIKMKVSSITTNDIILLREVLNYNLEE